MACPSFEDLLEAVENGSSSPAWQAVERHVQGGCRRCAARRDLLARMLAALEEAADPIPAHVLEAAYRIPFESPQERLPPPSVHEARLRAPRRGRDRVLVLRSLRTRGGDGRVAEYDAGPFKLDVSSPRDGVLVGHLSGGGDEGAEPSARVWEDAICVLSSEGGTQVSDVEPSGDFRFTGLTGGKYRLMIEGADHRVVLKELQYADESSGDAWEGLD